MKETTEYRGLWFALNTPQEVRDIIADHLRTGSHIPAVRLRIFYGDTETGQAWITEADRNKYDVRCAGEIGYIGRSTGTQKVPLAVYNKSNIGGGAILTDCIVRIETTQGKRVLYSHPNFHYKPEEETTTNDDEPQTIATDETRSNGPRGWE